jgi:putative YphP/YqiW family bacilliredoxin
MLYGYDMGKAVQMMREELTHHGVRELRTPTEVDQVLSPRQGTVLVVVNSVCGCAAGAARPGVVQGLQTAAAQPDHVTTVFAGQDREATERARTYFTGFAPSSPSVWLLKDGEVVFKLERHQIEHRNAQAIAAEIVKGLNTYCAPAQQAVSGD